MLLQDAQKELNSVRSGQLAHHSGIVTMRQQPDTVNATVTISPEDETGVVQLICRKSLRDAQRGREWLSFTSSPRE